MKKISFCLFLNLAFLLVYAGNPGEKQVKILTIGNSFAQNACTYLEEITASVPGNKIIITKANIGGCSLEKHARLISVCEMDSAAKPYRDSLCLIDYLQSGTYDFITIQQASPLSFKIDSLQPHAGILIDFVKAHAPQSEILIHQTWAYHPDCQRLKDWGITRDSMHRGILKTYNALISQYHFRMLPSGNAFYASFQKKPNIDLWNEKDRYHAGMNGNYLAGCVWFGVLFGISPTEISFVPEGMDAKTAKYLRKVADKVLLKSN